MNPTDPPSQTEDDPLERLRTRFGIRAPDAPDATDSDATGSDASDASGSFDVEPGDGLPRIPLRPLPPPESDGDDDILPETERLAPESPADLAVDDVRKKECRVCGRDLRGHRRYKDDRGYLCASCEKDDRARRIPCAECGKPTLAESLRPWGPISICARCFADHEADPKSRVKKKISTKGFDAAEKQKVLVIAGVAGVLLLLILLSWGGCIGG